MLREHLFSCLPPLSIAAGSLNQTVEIYFCFYNVPTTEGGYYADKPHNSHSREVLSEKKKKKKKKKWREKDPGICNSFI